MAYAAGKKAFGFCDRCGFRYPLKRLYFEYENNRKNGLRVCKSCLDEDNEQDDPSEIRYAARPEYIALRDPRPPNDLNASRGLHGFGSNLNPASSSKIRIYLGTVTVTTT